MNIKKLIPLIINSLDTINTKSVTKDIKVINKLSDTPLKVKELQKVIRAELKKKKQQNKLINKNNPLEITSSKALLKTNFDKEWIIKDLLPADGLTILSGRPGNFKTWVTLYFAICISEGSSVFGVFKTKKANVLIIDEEDSGVLIKDRLEKLGIKKETEINLSIMIGFKADNEEKMNVLIKEIQKRNIKVVIIDSLIRIHSGDENSAKDMANLFTQISRLKKAGVTVLINHHHRKSQNNQDSDSQSMRGSVDILAALDCHMMINKKDNDLIIKQTKNRYQPEIKPFTITPTKTDNGINFDYKEGCQENIQERNNNIEVVLSLISKQEKPIAQDELAKELEGVIGKNKLWEILKTLEETKKISPIVKEKNKKYYIRNPAF
jgi:RecA-family ATPase